MRIETLPSGSLLISSGNIVSVYIPAEKMVYESGNVSPAQQDDADKFFAMSQEEDSAVSRDSNAYHFLNALLRVKQARKQA